ncbi:MAG: hypothetical protein ACAI43_26495 [Phycisphaerae bacterium]|nr:hypothetical protein [Tepidisphaeraceae bacterium]
MSPSDRTQAGTPPGSTGGIPDAPETWVITAGIVGALALFMAALAVPKAYRERGPVAKIEVGRTTFTMPVQNARLAGWCAVGSFVVGVGLWVLPWRRVRFAARMWAVTMAVAGVCHVSYWRNDRDYQVELTPDAVTAPRWGQIFNGAQITVRFANEFAYEDPGRKPRTGPRVPSYWAAPDMGEKVRIDLRGEAEKTWEAIYAAQERVRAPMRRATTATTRGSR